MRLKELLLKLQAHYYTGNGRIFSKFEWPEAPGESVVWVCTHPFSADLFPPTPLVSLPFSSCLLFLPNIAPFFWFSGFTLHFPSKGQTYSFSCCMFVHVNVFGMHTQRFL